MKALLITVLCVMSLGCSKSPKEAIAQNAGPDNAMTRYAENLARSEQRAKDTADKANAVIARQQDQYNQSTAGNN